MIFAFVVAASKLEAGLVIGWPTVLPKMQADNTTSFTIPDAHVSWLGKAWKVLDIA